MFPGTLLLLANALFFMLRINPVSGSFPKPLSPDEEEEAIAAMMEGDKEARNLLIERNLRLVAHIVKKYYSSPEDSDDLISIGTIGLIKGVASFKPDKNIRLSTYCSKCIENEIRMFFRSTKRYANDVSLYEPIDSDKDGNALSLLDIVSTEEDMFDEIELNQKQDSLYKFIEEELNPREKDIVSLRYGLFGEGPLTQREIAEKKGISRSYVSRIETKALKKLHSKMKDI